MNQINLSPATIKEYLASTISERRKIRVVLTTAGVVVIGPPIVAETDFAVFPGVEGDPTRMVPYSSIAYIENF